MTRLADMIEAQRALQVAMGFDIAKMNDAERIEYIHGNATNVICEIAEALGEVDWKPWTSVNHIYEDALFSELRDAWQCLTNMMMAAHPRYTPHTLASELETALYAKHKVNYDRIAANYDGRSTKCPGCKRALDDPAVECSRSAAGYHCAVTGFTTRS